MRTRLQAIADRLLLLRVIDVGNRTGSVSGTFKLMKIPFITELYSTKSGVNTFNYSFYRWTFGPFTTEIYEDADALARLGLSTAKEEAKVTERGRHLLEMASDLFKENREAVNFVDEACQKCARLSFGALKQLVYRETVVLGGKTLTIQDVASGLRVLSAVPDSRSSFTLGDDWIDTLWGYFNYSDEEMEDFATTRPFVLEEVLQ